ncbi:hypothetical protein [Rhizobium ecuadorense]|uniref:hypothetical protein n=1 Tax=Rhizobium ecuadorense TaxID=1671795 RepID=UPI00067356C2|nr:hypothetical protein [Rhizobium ecuadorense]
MQLIKAICCRLFHRKTFAFHGGGKTNYLCAECGRSWTPQAKHALRSTLIFITVTIAAIILGLWLTGCATDQPGCVDCWRVL